MFATYGISKESQMFATSDILTESQMFATYGISKESQKFATSDIL